MADRRDYWAGKTVLVAGAGGLIGAGLVRSLHGRCRKLMSWRRADGDLRDTQSVAAMFESGPFDIVFLMAATQGGLADHLVRPVAFVSDNARIALNVIDAAAERGVPQLVYAASGALYPESRGEPFVEADLASGPIDLAHRPYAAAKLLGVRLCEAYSAERGLAYAPAILNNTYGPGGTFDPERATLIHGMIHRAVEAKKRGETNLSVWGTGMACRDVLFVDDAVAALCLIAESQSPLPVNVASGINRSIGEIAESIACAAGLDAVEFDSSKPEGALNRAVDISRLQALGFEPKVSLETGVRRTLEACLGEI